MGLAVGAVYLASEPLRAAVPQGRLDYLMPHFIVLHLPAGVRGLLVAAILAAAMSSLDSALNSLSASTLRDFVEPRLGPQAPESHRLLASRLVTLGWGVAIVAFGSSSAISPAASSRHQPHRRTLLRPAAGGLRLRHLDRRARGPGVLAGVAAGLALNAGSPGAWGRSCSGCGGT